MREALRPVAAGAAEPVLFVVPEGATLRRVARALEDAGLVRTRAAFEGLGTLARRGGRAPLRRVRAPRERSAGGDPRRARAGRVKMWEVAIPEGLTAVEIAARVEEAGLASRDGLPRGGERSREPRRATASRGRASRATSSPRPTTSRRASPPRTWSARSSPSSARSGSRASRPSAARGLSMRQAVTLASLVEKETGAPAERPLVARRVPEPAPARHAARDGPGGDLRHPGLRREPDARAPRGRVEPLQHVPDPGAPARADREPRRRGAGRAVAEPAATRLALLRVPQRRHARVLAHLRGARRQRAALPASRRGRRWRRRSPEPQSYFTEHLPGQFERALRAQERAVEAAQRVLDGMRAVDTTIVVEGARRGRRHASC